MAIRNVHSNTGDNYHVQERQTANCRFGPCKCAGLSHSGCSSKTQPSSHRAPPQGGQEEYSATTRSLSATAIWRISKAIKVARYAAEAEQGLRQWSRRSLAVCGREETKKMTNNLLLTGALLATFAGGFLMTQFVFYLLLGS